MKKIILGLLMFLAVHNSYALHIEYGSKIIISRPVYEDVYIAGGTITINAPIHGDLICAGGTIIINDSVMNDIMVLGATVTFNGYVGDDIRCAGGQLYVKKNITGDLAIVGGKVIVENGVVIGKDLLMSGGDITFNGIVKNNIKAALGKLVFNGSVEGNTDIRGGKLEMNGSFNGASILSAPEIVIGNNASFNHDVRYWNEKGKLPIASTVKSGVFIYDPSIAVETGRWYYLGGVTILGLLWYIGMAFLMICITQYLFSTTMQKAGDTFFNKTLKSLGFGFLFFIAVPAAAFIAFISLIGVPIGLLLVFDYIILVILASVITSVVGANWLNNRLEYQWSYWRLATAALGIFVLLKLVSSVPFLGQLIMLIIVCIAFGAIILNIHWRRKRTAGALS